MRTISQKATRTMQAILSLILFLSPVGAQALGNGPEVRVIHRVEEKQFVFLIGPLAGAEAGAELRATLPVPVTGMIFRVASDLMDGAGRTFGSDVSWGMTLFTMKPDAQSWMLPPATARLSNGSPEVMIERPYGQLIVAGDSMLIVAALPTEGAPGAVLRITMDYEAVPSSRVAAVMIAPEETVASGSWTWRPEVSGKLVMITGRQLAAARTLVLENATTGEVIWDSGPKPSYGQSDDLVRPVATVQAGGLYRLRAIYDSAAPDQVHGGDTPLAIVFPGRATPSQR
jgi:hypothetical protein